MSDDATLATPSGTTDRDRIAGYGCRGQNGLRRCNRFQDDSERGSGRHGLDVGQ